MGHVLAVYRVVQAGKENGGLAFRAIKRGKKRGTNPSGCFASGAYWAALQADQAVEDIVDDAGGGLDGRALYPDDPGPFVEV